MHGFRKRLKAAINRSDRYADNIRLLSADADMGGKTIYNMLKDERLDISKTGPGLFGMARIASLLGESLDHLAGIAPPKKSGNSNEVYEISDHILDCAANQSSGTQSPSTNYLLKTHLKSGGMLEAFQEVIEHCDQYFPTTHTDETLKVASVGRRSLSSLTMGKNSAEALQAALSNVPNDQLKARWVSDYSTAIQRGTLVTMESLDVQMPNAPVRVKMDFIRVLLYVTDRDGDQRVLNFSSLVL